MSGSRRTDAVVMLRLSVAGSLLLGVVATARAAVPVGVTTITFTKTSATSSADRPLETTIWYPAVRGTGTSEALGLRDARVRRGRFPLIVFSHGSCGRPTEATYFTTALAAAGFVVAAPRHPGNTADEFPDCLFTANFVDSLANRVPDVRFTIDQMLALAADHGSRFARRLRSDAIGMTGLSFGGYTTLAAAQQDDRIRMALAMVPGGVDVLGPDDLGVPAMVIGSEHDQIVGFAQSTLAYSRLAGPRFLVELLGGDHLSVVDDCFNHELNVSMCVPGDIAQDDAHRLVLHFALPFVHRFLRQTRGPVPRVLSKPVDGVMLTAEPRR